MSDNQLQKPKKKRPGRKPGVKIRHGAYSLIARGHLPENRREIQGYLTEIRSGLIQDLGPTEEDLTTGQKILVNSIIGKVGILRCIEEFAREHGVFKKGGALEPVLGGHYLAYSNSVRLDLMALGIGRRERPAPSLAELIKTIDEEQAAKGSKVPDSGTKEEAIACPASPGREIQGEPSEAGKDIQADEGQGKGV